MRKIRYSKINFPIPFLVRAGNIGFKNFDAAWDPIVAFFLTIVKVGDVARFPGDSLPF